MVPNGETGEANAGLVVGEGESLLVDTLWDVRCTRQMLLGMEHAHPGAPIRTVVNTHSDGDHWWGNELVASARIVTSQRSLAIQRGQKTRELTSFESLGTLLRGAGRVPLPWPGRSDYRALGEMVAYMFGPYQFGEVELTPAGEDFSGELELDVGGREVHLIEVGPAHTPGDLIVHVPHAGVVFAADVMFLGTTPVMWAGPLANWLAALDRIEALAPEMIVPGHGPLTGLDGLDTVRGYWEWIEHALRERHEAGMGWARAAVDVAVGPEFQSTEYARWDAPERIVVNAHTLYAHWDGEPPEGELGARKLIEIFRNVAALRRDLPN